MSLQYWYMLPLAILVATTAMASGVGGATFFAPIFILGWASEHMLERGLAVLFLLVATLTLREVIL